MALQSPFLLIINLLILVNLIMVLMILEETQRITAAGGFVEFGRVNGNLALSRAFGDFDFKKSEDLPPENQIVTANPEILERQLVDGDEFIVVACDGSV
jgi:protein phosphatase 2C family protein 2/3